MNTLQTAVRSETERAPRMVLSVDDLSATEIRTLLDLADDARARRPAWSGALADRHVALVFDKPSTRTRVSFEVAVTAMGGTALALKGDELQLGRGESFEDTARALSCYVDAIVIRIADHRSLQRLAGGARVPVVNALTTVAHPCQTLADLQTIRQSFGALQGIRVAYVGDPNNVAHSLMLGAATVGMDFVIASPEAHPPDPAVLMRSAKLAEESGGRVGSTSDAAAAVAGARVVYTDTWTSMGFEHEEHERRAEFAPYQVTSALMEGAAKDAIVMHCLPAHRGEEIAADVLDGPRSVVWEQAENRLFAQMALLRWILKPSEGDAQPVG